MSDHLMSKTVVSTNMLEYTDVQTSVLLDFNNVIFNMLPQSE